MFTQFLEHNPYIIGHETQIQIECSGVIKEHTQSNEEEESSDEETYQKQYFEEKANQTDIFDEIYHKMVEEEGKPTFELEARQQLQIVDLQTKVVMLEFEYSALKKMNYDQKFKQHKNQLILEDNKRDREIMDKINIGFQNKLRKLEDTNKIQQVMINQLKNQMSTNIQDLQESAMKRINNQVKISDKVEIFRSKNEDHPQSLQLIGKTKSSKIITSKSESNTPGLKQSKSESSTPVGIPKTPTKVLLKTKSQIIKK